LAILRWLVWISLPILMLIAFYFVMNGRLDPSFPSELKRLEESISHDDWTGAAKEIDKLAKRWDSSMGRVQFFAERDVMREVGLGISRCRGYLKDQEKGEALAEVKSIEFFWNELEG
jgi:hypothetical protein